PARLRPSVGWPIRSAGAVTNSSHFPARRAPVLGMTRLLGYHARCNNAVRQQPDPKGLRPRPTLPSVASDVLVSRQPSAYALTRLPRHTSRAWLRAPRPWPPDRQSPPSSMRSAAVRLDAAW